MDRAIIGFRVQWAVIMFVNCRVSQYNQAIFRRRRQNRRLNPKSSPGVRICPEQVVFQGRAPQAAQRAIFAPAWLSCICFFENRQDKQRFGTKLSKILSSLFSRYEFLCLKWSLGVNRVCGTVTTILKLYLANWNAELTMGHILWPTWPIIQLTRDPHGPWPMTQSQTMPWLDHDYSRIMMSSRLLPSLLCNDVQSGILDLHWIPWPRKYRGRHWNHISICLSFKVIRKSMCNIGPYWNSRWRPPGGVSELGPNRKMILQGSSISVSSFIISPQSEIFYHIFRLSCWFLWLVLCICVFYKKYFFIV